MIPFLLAGASVRPPVCFTLCGSGGTGRSNRSSPTFPLRPAIFQVRYQVCDLAVRGRRAGISLFILGTLVAGRSTLLFLVFPSLTTSLNSCHRRGGQRISRG